MIEGIVLEELFDSGLIILGLFLFQVLHITLPLEIFLLERKLVDGLDKAFNGGAFCQLHL